MSTPLTPQQVAAINRYLDEHAEAFQELGKQLHDAFGGDGKGKDNISAQVRNLQQITLSAGSLAEVEDFVKNQMGREKGDAKWRRVGGPLLASLKTLREAARDGRFGREGKTAPTGEDQLGIRLRLARGWVRAVVAEYLYCKAQAESAMRDALLASDEELGERAIEAAQDLVRQYGHPVSRSQVKGLTTVAANEAGKLVDYANKQKDRAVKREAGAGGQRADEFRREALFWSRVVDLCIGAEPRRDWSLTQQLNTSVPAAMEVPPQPPGAKLTKEEQAALKQRKDDLKRWKEAWYARHLAVFFRRFCAEYLHDMPEERRGGGA